jgi:transposase
MLDLQALQATDPKALSPGELAEVFTKMVTHIGQQHQRIDSQEQAIKLRDAKLERVSFELARLKAWKFAARTERMNAQQRQLFEETLAADEASLQAQLEALQQSAAAPTAKIPRIQPKRQVLPEHLKRVVHTHEPENTICGCGAPMRRIGEDVSERLDVVPAQFFVHRHIRGKWACKCCERLVQEPVDPQIIDSGMPTAGLVAHTMVGHFVDHLPYYRLEQINARSGVHTPRSRRWRPGRAAAAQRCCPCTRCIAPSSWVLACCTPTRRR